MIVDRDVPIDLPVLPSSRLVHTPRRPDRWERGARSPWYGYRNSRGEVLVLVGAETLLQPDALDGLVEELRRQVGGLVTLLPRHPASAAAEAALNSGVTLAQRCWLPLTFQGRLMSRLLGPVLANGRCTALTRSSYEAAINRAPDGTSARSQSGLFQVMAHSGVVVRVREGINLVTDFGCRSLPETASSFRRNYHRLSGNSLPIALLGLIGVVLTQLLPPALPVAAWFANDRSALAPSLFALALLCWPRVSVALRGRETLLGLIWHPLTWLAVLALQSYSIFDRMCARGAMSEHQPVSRMVGVAR